MLDERLGGHAIDGGQRVLDVFADHGAACLVGCGNGPEQLGVQVLGQGGGVGMVEDHGAGQRDSGGGGQAGAQLHSGQGVEPGVAEGTRGRQAVAAAEDVGGVGEHQVGQGGDLIGDVPGGELGQQVADRGVVSNSGGGVAGVGQGAQEGAGAGGGEDRGELLPADGGDHNAGVVLAGGLVQGGQGGRRWHGQDGEAAQVQIGLIVFDHTLAFPPPPGQ